MALKRSPADVEFSKAYRAAMNWTCEKCGIQRPPTGTPGSDGLECSHRYGRRSRTVRWCVENIDCLCSSCHRYFEEHPFEYKGWCNDKDGDDLIEILTEKWRAGVKVPKSEEREIAKHYRAELKRILALRAEGVTGYIVLQSWQ